MRSVRLTATEMRVIQMMIYIAQAQGGSEGDYQEWKRADFVALVGLLEKLY